VYDIKIYRGNGGKAHSFLTLALREVEWSASLHAHFTVLESLPTHIEWESWWFPETERFEEEEIPHPFREEDDGSSSL
jgi:hypothetical protein